MIPKPIGRITKDDLLDLIRDGVAESRTIEYKQRLPGKEAADKEEFVADVSSFANAVGGDLIYGIEADDEGRPATAPGLEGCNADESKLRLQGVLDSSLEPRIMGIDMVAVDGFDKGPVLIIRIPRSLSSPHMVAVSSKSRFCTRHSAGKRWLDVHEIREAFALSGTLPERLRSFRAGRIGLLERDDAPATLTMGPLVIMHVIPASALGFGSEVDVPALSRMEHGLPMPMFDREYGLVGPLNHRYNFDGFVTYGRCAGGSRYDSYLQIFRNGAVEAVNAHVLRSHRANDRGYIPCRILEGMVISSLERFLRLEREVGMNPPFFMLLSLIGIRSYQLWGGASYRSQSEGQPVDRDDLLLPEVVIGEWSQDVQVALRPIFDSIWQAAGWERCRNYDEDGKWDGMGSER